jgi:tetratricopeptide (TPR) repeat protein
MSTNEEIAKLIQNGIECTKRSDFEGALEAANRALELESTDEDALYLRVFSLRRLRRYPDAEAALTTALGQYPKAARLLNQRGFLHYDQEQYEQAIQVFEQVLALEPKNTHALRGRITSLRQLRQSEAAEKAIADALGKLPGNVAILNERAWLHYDQEQYEQAIQVFEQMLALEPKNADALRGRISSLRQLRQFDVAAVQLQQALEKVTTPFVCASLREEEGWLFYDQDQFEEALKAFEAALTQHPSAKSASLAKVKSLKRLNRDAQALEALRCLQHQFPKDAEIAEELGFFYLNRNDTVNAQKEFWALHKKDPENIRALNGMGSVCNSEGRYEEAVRYFEQAIKLAPYYPALHTNLAGVLIKQEPKPREDPSENLNRAERHCLRALELAPRYSGAFGCLGMIAFKRGRLREAEDYFRSSIDADREQGRYADLGALYVLMARYEEAEQTLQKAIRLNKDDPQPRIELANLFLETGKTKEAVRECRQAAALAPNSDSAARALAIALMRAEEYSEAEKGLREALRKQDESRRWQLHLTLSQLLTRLGDKTSEDQLYEEALAEVKTAIRLKPNAPELYFHKGILCSKCKDPRGAVKDFKECLELDPHHFEAERYIRLIRPQIRGEDVRRSSQVGSWFVVVTAILLLTVLWIRYFVPSDLPLARRPTAASEVSALVSSEIAAALTKNGVVPAKPEESVSTAKSDSKPGERPTGAIQPPPSVAPQTSTFAGRISETMLTVMTPLLLGMIVVGFLLPALIRLKFAGIEAELTQPKEVISTGPKGEVSLGGSLSTIKQ